MLLITSKHAHVWPRSGFSLKVGENRVADVPVGARNRIQELEQHGLLTIEEDRGQADTLVEPAPAVIETVLQGQDGESTVMRSPAPAFGNARARDVAPRYEPEAIKSDPPKGLGNPVATGTYVGPDEPEEPSRAPPPTQRGGGKRR